MTLAALKTVWAQLKLRTWFREEQAVVTAMVDGLLKLAEERPVHVMRVVLERRGKMVEVRTEADEPRGASWGYYDPGEATSAAICFALDRLSRGVARGDLPAEDGFTVRVEFVHVAQGATRTRE